MIGYLIRRVIQAVIVVIGVCLITFGLYHLFPGGAVSEARIIIGPRATAGSIQLFIHQNGLDKPIWTLRGNSSTARSGWAVADRGVELQARERV